MLSLLVADDEDIVRSAIKSIIGRGALAIHLIGEAATGEEAISLAHQMRPKIVLMDVKMPGLNGLEAARAIRAESPSTKIIMLTAYDEFSFAQEALRLGASDYLLKPIRPSALLEVLSRIQKEIEQEEKHLIETEQASTRLRDSLPLIEARLVYDLVQGAVSSSKASDLIANHLGKSIAWPVVMLVDIDRFQATVQGMEAEKLDLFCNLLTDIVRRAIPVPERCLVGQIRPGIIAVILSAEDEFADSGKLRALGHTIRSAIESGAPVTATIGIGRRCEHLDMIPLSYSQASEAIWHKLHFGRNSVITSDDLQRLDREPRPYPLGLEHELIANIRLGQRQASTDLLGQIVDFMLEKLAAPPETIYTRFMELMVLISRAVMDTGAPIAEILELSHQQLKALRRLKTGSEMRAWIIESMTLMMSRIPSADRGDMLVEQAIALMREKLDQPGLQLKDIAAAIHVSPSHLAHLLKERTGVSYVRYMMMLRMEKAKKLLATTDMTMAAVASAVGYEDASYFHRIFRRETAMTPSAYRRLACSGHASTPPPLADQPYNLYNH